MKFTVNSVKAEVDVMKRLFSNKKMSDIELNITNVKDLTAEIEILKVHSENHAKNSDVLKLKQ